MDRSLAAIKAQLDMHTRWYNNVLKDITNDESHRRDDDRLNHMKWVAGHLLNTRATSMSRIAGLATDDSYAAQFARGSALTDVVNYPPLEDILARWNSIAVMLSEAVLQIPADRLAAKFPAQMPIGDDTVHGAWSFLISHEAFHIGQLSVLRKMIGKEAMSYG